MEVEKVGTVESLIELVNEISAISDYRSAVKKDYCNLARRLKLLAPLFEEIRDSKEPTPEESLKALVSLKQAMESAKELLRFGSKGSKIYMERSHGGEIWVNSRFCLKKRQKFLNQMRKRKKVNLKMI